MMPVVLAETDQPLQRLIHKVLLIAGYSVLLAPDRHALWQHTASSPDPCVIMLGDRLIAWRDDIILDTLHTIEMQGAGHAVIMLTATPENMSLDTRALLYRSQVPVVPLPFELDRLVATVAWSATHVLRRRPDAIRPTPPAAFSGTFNPDAQPYEPPRLSVAGARNGIC